jgi:hypothetical protein
MIEKILRGFVQDYKFNFEIYSSSFFQDFRDKLNFTLLELDRLRCVPISLFELVPGFETSIELELTGIKLKDNDATDKTSRSFDLVASYTASLTVATQYTDDAFLAVNLYLNDQKKVWSSLPVETP